MDDINCFLDTEKAHCIFTASGGFHSRLHESRVWAIGSVIIGHQN